jgi:hypothetical protein
MSRHDELTLLMARAIHCSGSLFDIPARRTAVFKRISVATDFKLTTRMVHRRNFLPLDDVAARIEVLP